MTSGAVICAATLLAEIGDCRGRYPHRDSIAADSGQAPGLLTATPTPGHAATTTAARSGPSGVPGPGASVDL
jgi:hypothetical protein